LIDYAVDLFIVEIFVLAAELPQIKLQIFDDNVEFFVVAQVFRSEDIVDFYYFWMPHASKDGQLS
jgi:hypothetical protein